jgi:hypothetical protein
MYMAIFAAAEALSQTNQSATFRKGSCRPESAIGGMMEHVCKSVARGGCIDFRNGDETGPSLDFPTAWAMGKKKHRAGYK